MQQIDKKAVTEVADKLFDIFCQKDGNIKMDAKAVREGIIAWLDSKGPEEVESILYVGAIMEKIVEMLIASIPYYIDHRKVADPNFEDKVSAIAKQRLADLLSLKSKDSDTLFSGFKRPNGSILN